MRRAATAGRPASAGTALQRSSWVLALVFTLTLAWGMLLAGPGALAAPTPSEQAQTAPEQAQTAPEQAQAAPEQAQTAPEQAQATPEQAQAAPEQAHHLVILYQNDFHGRLEPVDTADGVWGGFARIAHIVEAWRTRRPGQVLWFDAGDTLHGTPLANLFDGEAVVDALNAAGLDAMVLGNHDFNFGQAVLAERMEQARFPMLSANTVRVGAAPTETPDGARPAAPAGWPIAPPIAFFDVSGLRVAVLGLTTPHTSITTHPAGIIGLAFQDPFSVAASWVPVLRKQADIVVALTHLGYDVDRELAATVPGIDVIVGGHSHTTLEGAEQVADTIIVQAGEHGRYVGVLELTVEGGRIVEHSARLVPVTPDVPAHPDLEALIKRWAERLTARLEEPVGRTAVDLGGEDRLVRGRETALANLIADAFREAAGADIGLVNGGAVRGFIPAGPIRLGDLNTVLPFAGTLVGLELTGAELIDVLEHGLQGYPELWGGFPQVSGLTYVFDPRRPAGERLVEVKVGGEPLDYGRTYRVAVNDFIAAGGDGYAMLAKAPVYFGGGGDGGISVQDAVRLYLEKAGEVAPRVEGRIRTVERVEAVEAGQPAAAGTTAR